MRPFIRLGDILEHGGTVLNASQKMRIRDRYVARKGNEVQCDLHPGVIPNVIAEGDGKTTDSGVPVARQGHRALCGCQLLSSLN